jgi:hypothetical protein
MRVVGLLDAGVVVVVATTNVATIAATTFKDIAMLPLRPEWSDRFDGQSAGISEHL